MNRQRLLERFLRYVKIDTTAGDGSAGYPSSPGQLELGRLLRDELVALGLTDVVQSEFGIVTATVHHSIHHAPRDASPHAEREGYYPPVIAFCSHLDTSPETTGRGVRPQVIERYAGGDISLGTSGLTIRVADNPELANMQGRTLITTDGTTLLGGDDKAGIAVIMEAAAHLMENPAARRPPIKICFTCDEEIGHGVDHINLAALGATVCYTLDGQGQDEIDVETFSADLATVTVRGVNIHPSIGKGRMINAVRVAADLVARLPRTELAPEATADRQGFLHPYIVSGGVGEVTMQILLRDFDTAALHAYAALLRHTAQDVATEMPGSQIDVKITPQYRNLAEGLKREPRAVAYAEEALRRLGRQPKCTIVRGGTDGSRLTELGLPTPNLSTGQHNPHSPLEWACLDEMEAAAEMLVELAAVWSEA
ncbi:MAG: peptidase T [Planctomycetes bacterium]|nr:peptidase T [Planctomycetota bacterium]